MSGTRKGLSKEEQESLVGVLEARFEKNKNRHRGLTWAKVLARLKAHSGKLASLSEMEKSGGEPDVVVLGNRPGEIVFCDCSEETPSGRRSLCYDKKALDERTEFKPRGSAVGMAESMGVEILSEADYRALQEMGEFDLKTSSWILTPPAVRKLGGALFCDRRYDQVFVYHNGASSYYASRAFRASLKV